MSQKFYSPIFILLVLLSNYQLNGQATLFEEDFNSCDLSSKWQVTTTGNPDAVWYVGEPQDPNSDGTSIDGSCMLLFDDDATGDQTPEWEVTLISEEFDGTAWPEIELSIDVSFRNYDEAAGFGIYVNDGQEWHTLSIWKEASTQTGEQLSDYVTFTADLSFYASTNMRIAMLYNDGGSWGWWAGVDNITVSGKGDGNNVLLENFNNCSLPAGWINAVQTGNEGWKFGLIENNPNTGGVTSMNGSCFAYFDDDIQGQDAAPSYAILASPIIDGSEYANYYLDYDVILRRYADLENLSIGVYDEETTEIFWAVSYYTDMGGPGFNEYVHETVDLSAYRRPQMRILFSYSDGNAWGWWAGIDNVKLVGEGFMNDICSQAQDIQLNQPCTIQENALALNSSQTYSCSSADEKALWYRFEAPGNGLVQAISNAGYNDVITVLKGDCDNLEELACTNYDEFGFAGEELIWEMEAGEAYFIRLSGHLSDFGISRGQHCLELIQVDNYPTPPDNEDCGSAISLEIDGDCINGNNFNAYFDDPIPSLNNKSKADVWYTFETTSDQSLEILSKADFADVLTIYKGDCNQLEEVACNELGQRLIFESPVANVTYLLQISGYFATLEGNLCLEINTLDLPISTNKDCISAITLTLGEDCIEGNNEGADFSGPISSCDIYLDHSLWYTFEAPTSGRIEIKTEATFVHSVSIFEGNCNELEEVFCHTNPLACEGNSMANGLYHGQIYYLRISSLADITGLSESGDFCLSLIDGLDTEEYTPIALSGSIECYDNGTAQLLYEISGGQGNYTIEGNASGEILTSGTSYIVLVTDEKGCEASLSGEITCAVNCNLNATAEVLSGNDCPNDYTGAIALDVDGGDGPFEFNWSNGSTEQDLSDVANGFYSVTISDTTGNCVILATAEIPGPPAFQFEIEEIVDASSTTASDGAIDISFLGGTPPYSFNWYLDNELVSTEEDPQELLAGEYTLEVIDGDNCMETYEGIVVSSPSNAGESASNAYFDLYPNPTTQHSFLEWQLDGPKEIQVSIFDASGKAIQHYAPLNSRKEKLLLNFEGQAAGLYFIRLQVGDEIMVKKVVVTR